MAKDLIHNAVGNALEKDGWTIVADPFRLDFKNFALRADLAARKLTSMEKLSFASSLKSSRFVGQFVRPRITASFIGQYQMYQDALILNQLDYTLYLGIGRDAYKDYFLQSGAEYAIQRYRIKLLVVDTNQEEISQWIE
ncbi:MAG: element excision factor XisH family protein [Caldilineaceae bacterium]